MKLDRVLWGQKVILIPYGRQHVDKYHRWMLDPVLQRLTGSEPLTLEEEYEMQITWNTDSDKCTFIILDRAVFARTSDEVEAMIGDINLFSQTNDRSGEERLFELAECSVMIAEESSRKKGFGREAMFLMLRFAIDELASKSFVARIKTDNVGSQEMFLKMGFKKVSVSQVFQEITFNADVRDVLEKIENYNLLYDASTYDEFRLMSKQ
ncbi:N-acetyltransferase 9-like protein [Galendromus occidentalis]|uniref:N-acetyltransferase 9-like protein n=1 Tax=Galendromus occidentalis TaxID=34638 RepID=A0AAJ6VY59_9ACAR|nr:N-acetyltransferase 9-like protein [Galendromus occidentalis]